MNIFEKFMGKKKDQEENKIDLGHARNTFKGEAQKTTNENPRSTDPYDNSPEAMARQEKHLGNFKESISTMAKPKEEDSEDILGDKVQSSEELVESLNEEIENLGQDGSQNLGL